ncbi:MAG TPA: hypothetical protein VES67_04175 [Vicinamibacterales bacterium]|nr:hypothetical protein [Vicinamibacterales bacterium]
MAASTAGEIIRVVYQCGSQPGTIREIVPLAVSDEEVVAHDVAAGIDKTFKLAYLQLAGAEGSARAYDPTGHVDDSRTLPVAIVSHLERLHALGWHVDVTDTCVSLHSRFKNGKLRKGADVAIMFNEFVIDAWDDGGGWREEGVKSKRPFYVSAPTFERARTFAHLSVALTLFLEEAAKHAPSSRV